MENTKCHELIVRVCSCAIFVLISVPTRSVGVRFGEDYPVLNQFKVESEKLKVAILLTRNLKLLTDL